MKKIADYLPSVDQKYYIDEYGNIYDSDKRRDVLYFFNSKNEHSVKLVTNEYPFFKIYRISTLVNLIFNGFPNKQIETPITVFIDHDKNNLYYKNLKWYDRKTNLKYKSLNYSRVEQKIHMNDIVEIYNMYKKGQTIKEIAAAFNLDTKYVYKLLSGRKRVADLQKLNLKPLINPKPHINEADAWNICEVLCKFFGNVRKTCSETKFSDSIIRQIYNYNNHTHISKFFDFDNGINRFDESDEFSLNDNKITKIGKTDFIFKED